MTFTNYESGAVYRFKNQSIHHVAYQRVCCFNGIYIRGLAGGKVIMYRYAVFDREKYTYRMMAI